jgi:hypothetical protein
VAFVKHTANVNGVETCQHAADSLRLELPLVIVVVILQTFRVDFRQMSNASDHLYLLFEGGKEMVQVEFLEGGLQLQVKVQIAGIPPRFVKLKHPLPRLH